MGLLKNQNHAATVCDETCTDNCQKVDACTQVDMYLRDEASTQVEMNLSGDAFVQTEKSGPQYDDKIIKCIIAEYEKALEEQKQRIRELEEQLAMSTAAAPCDLLSDVDKLEKIIRNYAEKPIIKWSDDCECKSQIVQLADQMKMLLKKESVANDLPAAATFPATSCRRPNPCVAVATQVVRPHADVETQADIDVHSEQRASAEDLEEMTLTIFSLETSNEDLTRAVERLEKEIAIKNKTMDDILEDTEQQIQHLKKKFLDDHRELIRQNRAMRDELQSYKEKRDDLQHARAQVTALRSKYYKETAALQRTVDQLRQQLNEQRPRHRQTEQTEHHHQRDHRHRKF